MILPIFLCQWDRCAFSQQLCQLHVRLLRIFPPAVHNLPPAASHLPAELLLAHSTRFNSFAPQTLLAYPCQQFCSDIQGSNGTGKWWEADEAGTSDFSRHNGNIRRYLSIMPYLPFDDKPWASSLYKRNSPWPESKERQWSRLLHWELSPKFRIVLKASLLHENNTLKRDGQWPAFLFCRIPWDFRQVSWREVIYLKFLNIPKKHTSWNVYVLPGFLSFQNIS